MIEQTATLKANASLAGLVKDADQLLQDELQRYSRLANAKWDIQEDDKGRPLFLLTLRDLFGFASDRFAPDELQDHRRLVARLHRLVGDLLQSSRRVSVLVQETTISAQQLEALRMAMDASRTLLAGRPKLQNQVLRINADGSFTVRDFAVEVDADAAVVAAARKAVIDAGLTPKGDSLAGKPAIQKAVRALVTAHLQDPENPPQFVLWFRLDDPKDVHLLEIADDVADPGDGSLDGVALGAGSAIPGARSIVLYLASPSEIHKAFEVNPGHPAIEAMINRSGQVLYPRDDWQSLIHEFPEMVQQAVS
jgi:hypothetical protein